MPTWDLSLWNGPVSDDGAWIYGTTTPGLTAGWSGYLYYRLLCGQPPVMEMFGSVAPPAVIAVGSLGILMTMPAAYTPVSYRTALGFCTGSGAWSVVNVQFQGTGDGRVVIFTTNLATADIRLDIFVELT